VLAMVAAWQLIAAYRRGAAISAELRAEMADVPMAPLQLRAWRSMLLVLLGLAAITLLITTAGGAEVFWVDDDVRLAGTLGFIAVLIGHGIVLYAPLQGLRKRGDLDERDRRIVDRAPAFQGLLMILVLAAWVLGLGEAYHDPGAVPVVYLNLIFGSTLLMHPLGMSLGIVIGYRRSDVDAEG